jgi:hypothetical protein
VCARGVKIREGKEELAQNPTCRRMVSERQPPSESATSLRVTIAARRTGKVDMRQRNACAGPTSPTVVPSSAVENRGEAWPMLHGFGKCRLKVVQCSAKKDQNRLNGCSATAVILCIGALRRGEWRRADEDIPHKDVGERPTTLHYPTKIGIILIAVAKIQLVVWRIRSSP